jgi:hypothetical protein
MNNKQTNNVRKQEWYDCDRCDFQYPRDKMITQNGLVLCHGPNTCNCVDEQGTDAFLRERISREKPTPPLPQRNEVL